MKELSTTSPPPSWPRPLPQPARTPSAPFSPSTSLATQTAELVQDKLNLPDAAFSYLRSHGDLDIAHVDFYAKLLDELSAAEMTHVIHVAKRVYALYGDVLRSLSDLEVANVA